MMTYQRMFLISKLKQQFLLLLLICTVGCEGQIVASDYSGSAPISDSGVSPFNKPEDAGVIDQKERIDVRILSPESGALLGPGVLSVTATVVSSIPILRVNFFIDEQQLAADFDRPYSATIPIDSLDEGPHTLSVTAIGFAGESGEAAVAIDVDATFPEITTEIDSRPSLRLATTSTVIEGLATDNRGIASVALYVDGIEVLTSTDARFRFEYDFQNSGSFRVFLKAVDLAGNTSVSSEWQVEIDQPPAVMIEQPTSGAIVSGHVLLRALISDDNGINRVVWSVDNVVVGEYESAPFSHLWSTCSLPPGTRTLGVSVQDSAGQLSFDEVTVSVENEAEPITLAAYPLSRSVKLAWTSCASSTGHAYRVYYGDTAGVNTASPYIDVGETNVFSISNLSPNGSTFYRVARVRNSGLVSPLSNEVAVTTYGEFAGVLRTNNSLGFASVSLDELSFAWQRQESYSDVVWSPDGQRVAVVRTASTTMSEAVSILESSGVTSSTNTALGRFPEWSETMQDLYSWRPELQSICLTEIQTSSSACVSESATLSELRVVSPASEEMLCLEVENPDGSLNLWLRDWSGTRYTVSTDVYSYQWVQDDTAIVMLVESGAGTCRLAYLNVSASGPQAGYYLVEDVSCAALLAWSDNRQTIYFTQSDGNTTQLYSYGISAGTITSLVNLVPTASFDGSAYGLSLSNDEQLVTVSAQVDVNEFIVQVAPVDGSTVTTVLSAVEQVNLVVRPSDDTQP